MLRTPFTFSPPFGCTLAPRLGGSVCGAMDALEFLACHLDTVRPLCVDRDVVGFAEEQPAVAFRRFRHQVAGHADFFLLHGRDAHLFKPENPLETATYRVMQHAIPAVAAFAPRCFGIATIAAVPSVSPKNVCSGFAKPCVLDVKLGTRQHGLHVPLSKVLSKTARCMQTTSAGAGLRVCGIQVFHGAQSTPLRRDKHYGRALTRRRLPEAMALFLSGADPPLRATIAASFVRQIESLRDAVAQANWRFWSCSVILVYDAAWRTAAELRPRLHLVDFAHTCMVEPGMGPDAGTLLGLQSLAHLFA